MYCIVAVSAQHGLESFKVYRQSINSISFKTILLDINSTVEAFDLFGDNASYHFSKVLKQCYLEYKTEIIAKISYMPELNGTTESCIRVIKGKLKPILLTL